MSRYTLLPVLTLWSVALLARSGEHPGLPGDPTAAEPPPRVESDGPAPQPPPPGSRANAGEEVGEDEPPAPPVLPEPMKSGEAIEPEVTIRQREDATVEEYRINGRMYMVKVIPRRGKPYYLIDRDGDGQLETRMSDLYDDPVVPQWILFSW